MTDLIMKKDKTYLKNKCPALVKCNYAVGVGGAGLGVSSSGVVIWLRVGVALGQIRQPRTHLLKAWSIGAESTRVSMTLVCICLHAVRSSPVLKVHAAAKAIQIVHLPMRLANSAKSCSLLHTACSRMTSITASRRQR